MRHPLTFSALAVLVASVAAPLQAAEPAKPDPFIIRFLGKDPTTGKASACFIRTYDNAHLAAHPQQKVTAMMLLVRGEFDKESKTVDYSFSLGLKLRGKNARFQSAGSCHHALEGDDGKASATFGCGVDCDGGGFELGLSDDAKSAMLKLDRAVSIWLPGKDDGPDRDTLEAGADDHSFRLDRTSLADCVPLADDKKEAAEMKAAK